jgi:hypothetical protein
MKARRHELEEGNMRYLLGIVEILLAIAFIGTGIKFLVTGLAIVQISEALIMFAIGGWLGKVALRNFQAPKPAALNS